MTPVAAMFVGNIVIFDEQEKNRKLKENTKFAIKGLSTNVGEKIGEFRMGSAIVLKNRCVWRLAMSDFLDVNIGDVGNTSRFNKIFVVINLGL
uniref:Aldedh domain-containing protein n=1 Tax=Meloidogyne hapla TaxID=6305 RepID=A0A1I8BJX3_MELHA